MGEDHGSATTITLKSKDGEVRQITQLEVRALSSAVNSGVHSASYFAAQPVVLFNELCSPVSAQITEHSERQLKQSEVETRQSFRIRAAASSIADSDRPKS